MGENSSLYKNLDEVSAEYVRGYFDGIKFLWQTPEFRYYIKLLVILLVSLGIYYTIAFLLSNFLGEFNLITLIFLLGVGRLLLIVFLYIVIELLFFYRNARSYKNFPEKNKFLKMKYWDSSKYALSTRKIRLTLFFTIFIVLSLFLVAEIVFYNILTQIVQLIMFILGAFLFFSSMAIMGILAFMATRDKMQSFEEKHSEKFYKNQSWSFFLFPIPWIFFLLMLFTFQYIRAVDVMLFAILGFLSFMFLILGFIGIPALIKKNWRSGYTISHISAIYTIVAAILIPFIIGMFVNLAGPIISFIIIVFFFIQGTLDDIGDELRKYYADWDKKLQKFNIKSKEDISNQTYEEPFLITPLSSDSENAISNLAVSLIILIYTLYTFITLIANSLLYEIEEGTIILEIILLYISGVEFFGILIAVIIFTFVIIIRQSRKYSKVETVRSPGKSYIICSNCKQNVKADKFCEKCGTRLYVVCPNCQQSVVFDNFCEKCGAPISKI